MSFVADYWMHVNTRCVCSDTDQLSHQIMLCINVGRPKVQRLR